MFNSQPAVYNSEFIKKDNFLYDHFDYKNFNLVDQIAWKGDDLITVPKSEIDSEEDRERNMADKISLYMYANLHPHEMEKKSEIEKKKDDLVKLDKYTQEIENQWLMIEKVKMITGADKYINEKPNL